MRQCLAPAVYRQEDRERLLRGAASLAQPALMDADVSAEASSFGLLNGLYWLVATLGDEPLRSYRLAATQARVRWPGP